MTTLPPHLRPRLTASVAASLSASSPALASHLLSAVNDAINLLPAGPAEALVDALAAGDLAKLRVLAEALPRMLEADQSKFAAADVSARILAEPPGATTAALFADRATKAALWMAAEARARPVNAKALDAARLRYAVAEALRVELSAPARWPSPSPLTDDLPGLYDLTAAVRAAEALGPSLSAPLAAALDAARLIELRRLATALPRANDAADILRALDVLGVPR